MSGTRLCNRAAAVSLDFLLLVDDGVSFSLPSPIAPPRAGVANRLLSTAALGVSSPATYVDFDGGGSIRFDTAEEAGTADAAAAAAVTF